MSSKESSGQDDVFDLADFALSQSAMMQVVAPAGKINWTWEFSGPGHPKTIEQRDKANRKLLHKERLQQQAIVNGKKWVEPEKDPAIERENNVQFVAGRLIDWSPISFAGKPYPFSEENARKLLLDPNYEWLLSQAVNFLVDDNSFTKRSENK